MSIKSVALLSLACQIVEAVRVRSNNRVRSDNRVDDLTDAPETEIAGVPVYNYGLRFEGKERSASDGVLDWMLMLNDGKDISGRFCAEVKCSFLGSGDIPFVAVKATEEELHKLLAAHFGEVRYVEPDLPVYDDPELPEEEVPVQPETPWSHGTINLDKSTYTGKGVHIYVVDTGIRTTHEDFGGRAVPTVDTFRNPGTVFECDPSDTTCGADTHGHGTHCAGTAGGSKYGAAKEASLYAVKTCCGLGSNTYGGLDWIAQNKRTPAIVTMSLGRDGTSITARDVVDAVVAAGITVFVSGGNKDIDACTKTYSFIPSVISVASIDSTNARSSFSNWGSCNMLYAPGRSILSASHTSDSGSSTMTGTSMAAPLAAGVGALILEDDSLLSPSEVRQALERWAVSGVVKNRTENCPDLLLSAVKP